MNGLEHFATTHPTAQALLTLALVSATGLAVGNIRFRGLGLGIAGVLFSGIVFGHFGITIDSGILEFVRDFGLVLFVYTIGVQVGPGFFTSLRRHGLPLNLMAAGIVLLGAAVTLLVAWIGGIDIAVAIGLFSGGVTNTPALGAAQEALRSMAGIDSARLALPALGYAVAYPFGIIGIILSMTLLRAIFRVDVKREDAAFRSSQQSANSTLERMNLEIDNPNLNGVMIRDLPGRRELGVIISRIQFAGESEATSAHGETLLHAHDTILAVGTADALDKFRLIVGRESGRDLMKAPGRVTSRRVIVTRAALLGRSLRQLGLNHLYAVTITRVTRADIEMTTIPDLRLQFGDVLQVVGDEESIQRVADAAGNSLKELNHTNFVSVFVGIALGILVGSFPLHIPGMLTPITLGVAGGPLLVAILLSRLGRIGSITWHMPENANIALREFGITLFLASVGLKAGAHFFQILLEGRGLSWMAYGAAITLAPLLTVGWIGRAVFKLNFMNLCGLLAGSMTDPPALAFANSIAQSNAPSIAYATVYPLTMILRILVVQIIVLVFAH